jgi:hypothetical protein
MPHHSSREVLASAACQRIENGVPTTGRPGRGSQNCATSADLLTYIERVDNRRFPIVDMEHGIVVATVHRANLPSEQTDSVTLTSARPRARGSGAP